MILDSMKTRGFYAFFNRMKFSGTLGLYLVALFMCLGFEVKAVDLPARINTTCDWGGTSVNLTKDKDGCYSTSDVGRLKNCEWWVETNGGALIVVQLKFNIACWDGSTYSNTPDSNGHNPQLKTDSNISVYIYYYNSQWIATENQSEAESLAQDPNGGGGGENPVPTISNVPTPNAQCASNQINIQTPSVDYHGSNANGSCWQYKNNNNQWEDISSSTRLSVGTYSVRYIARSSNGQTATSDETSLTINDKPTINTSTISTPSAGSTLSSVTISVDANGSNITSQVWKKDGNNIDPNSLTFQAGQTYNLTYEVTNGCGTSSKDYTVTIPSVPTISNVPTPNVQCASNQINIQTPSVDYHGSNANGSCWQYKNNNNQWEDISSSTRLSVGTYSVRYIARSSNGQTATSDETSLTINDKPTINTSTISTPSAGSTLSSVTISVDANGSNITSQVWKKDGNNIDPNSLTFQAGQTYNLTYEVTNGCGTSSKNYTVTIPSGGSSSYHIRCTSGNYGNNGGTVIELNENSGCYYTTSTTPLLYSNWQFEDSGNNVIPLRTEFSFFVWGNENQLYNNNNGNTLTSIQPLQHCGWDRTNSYTSNCASYSGPYYTLYIYQKNGEWYASETCNGTVPSTLSITPNTAQKVACDDITFLASESSNSLEWYYGSTKLSDGNGITINGNSLTISPSYVYANGSANVYAKNGDAESNKVSVGRSEIRLRTNNNENVTLTRYTNARCPGMCAYMFNFNQINNFWTQWWFEQDGVKMSMSIAPGSHGDFKIENGNFNQVDRSKFSTGYIYYDNGWVFSNEDPCRCMTLSVDNAASACGHTIITLNNTCGEITNWTWQRSNDGNNNWNNVTNGGLTYDASGVNNTVYFRVVSGNEKSNVVKVSKSGVEIAQNGNANNYTSLTKVSGCSTCAFVVPLNGSVNSMQNDDWYFRTSSGARINVIVDSDASFVTKNGENFYRVDNNSTNARLYGNLYLYEDSGTWHLTTTNPCPCISVNTSGNISCENATFVITNGCGNEDVRSYKLERWDGNNWSGISEGSNNSISVTSNNINGARYVRAGYAYGNNWTWVYSEPIAVSYLPFDFNSVYDVPQLASSATGAQLEVSQISPLCCDNFEITVRNTGKKENWNGWAYMHVAGYKIIIAEGSDNNNIAVNKVGNEDVLAVSNSLANQKFYIYVDDTNKKIYVSSHNDRKVIAFEIDNVENFPCGDITLTLLTEPCDAARYQWYVKVNGNISEISGATGKTLYITKEMYEANDFSYDYGIRVYDRNNASYQRDISLNLNQEAPSATGVNGVTIDRILTLCCDDNGGKLYRVEYEGTGNIQLEGVGSHYKIEDAGTNSFNTTSNGVSITEFLSPLYVYIKGDKAFWSTTKTDSYINLNLTENICDVCSGNRAVTANLDFTYKSDFGLDNPAFTWEGSNNGRNWTSIDGVTGPTLSGEIVEKYTYFRVSLSMGCAALKAQTTINCTTYPSVSISGILKKCQVGALTMTRKNVASISCEKTFELQESEDGEIWAVVNPSEYTVTGNVTVINSVSSTYYRYVLKVNGNEIPSNIIKAQEVAGFDLKVSYDKTKVYGVNHINNEVVFFATPSTVAGYWEKLENGAWVDARTLANTDAYEISGAETTSLKYKIKDDNHKAIFRFFATEKCTRSESVELKINEIDPICASEGSIIISFNGMNGGQFVAEKNDDAPYMFIHPEDSRCYDPSHQGVHNSYPYSTGDPNHPTTYLGIPYCSRIGSPTFPTAQENVFGKNNAYYIVNRNAMKSLGGSDAVLPPTYLDNDMYYLWWHGGEKYRSNENVTLPKIYPMLGIQYPSEIASGSTGKISVRFWLITDGLEGDNPCHFGFFSDRHGSKTVENGVLVSTLEENPFYNQNCTVTCEETGETWQMSVNNSMMATPANNDCLTEVKVSNAAPGWYTMTAEFRIDGMLTSNDCPVFYPMVLPYSNKVGVAVEYLITDMNDASGSQTQEPITPAICVSAETACTDDAVSLFVKGLENLDPSVHQVNIRWYDEANPNTPLVQQTITDVAGNGVSRFDTHFPEGVSYINYRCEVEIEEASGSKTTFKNNVQVGRDAECSDCVYIGEDLENVIYTKDVDVRILSTNADLPIGVEYVWQWSDSRYNAEQNWIDIPSESYTPVDDGTGINLHLKRSDFDAHPYIRVVIKEEGEIYCSSNAILLSPMETTCSWEIKDVETINPQEYEVRYADVYRIVFHVENNEDWVNDSPTFIMTDVQSGESKEIVCTDKDIDGNWYYDVEAMSDYEFTVTHFCAEFNTINPDYKSIIVRNIKECQSTKGTATRVWYDDFGTFSKWASDKRYPLVTPNGEGGYNFSEGNYENPDWGFRHYERAIEIDGEKATTAPYYYTSNNIINEAFARDETHAITNAVQFVTDLGQNCWGGGTRVVNYHVNDGSYAIVYDAVMGSCVDWALTTEDHTPGDEHGGMLFINMPPSGGTVYSGSFRTKCREAVAIVSCYVANANQKDGKIPCNVTFNIKKGNDTLASYNSGDIFSRYQSDPAYQKNPWTHLTFRVPLTASYQAAYYEYTFEIVSKSVNTTEGNDFLFDDVEIFVCDPDVTISSEDRVTHEQEIDLCDPNPMTARVYAVPEVPFCNFFTDVENLKMRWQKWTGGESEIGVWEDVFVSEGDNGRELKDPETSTGPCQDKYTYFYPLGQIGDYRLRVIAAESNVLDIVMQKLDPYKNVLDLEDGWPQSTCNELYAHSSDFWVHVHESREEIDTVLYECPGETVVLEETIPDGYDCEWLDIEGNVLKSESDPIDGDERVVTYEFVKSSSVDKVIFIATPGIYNTDPTKRVCPRSTNYTVNIPQTVKIECSAQSLNLACQTDFEKSEGATLE